MAYLDINAQDVRIGDQIFIEGLAKNDNHCYADVKKVKRESDMWVKVTTSVVVLWFFPDQKVPIQRFSNDKEN